MVCSSLGDMTASRGKLGGESREKDGEGRGEPDRREGDKEEVRAAHRFVCMLTCITISLPEYLAH